MIKTQLGKHLKCQLQETGGSCFAAMGAWAQSQEQMLLLRFLVGLGVDGLWPNGVALVAECWPGARRPLVTGYNDGRQKRRRTHPIAFRSGLARDRGFMEMDFLSYRCARLDGCFGLGGITGITSMACKWGALLTPACSVKVEQKS